MTRSASSARDGSVRRGRARRGGPTAPSSSDALAELSWSGEIVIDATNAVLIPSLEPLPLGGLTSSEIVAQLVPGSRLVKAANTFAADVLGADPREAGGRRVMFVSGDDADAR